MSIHYYMTVNNVNIAIIVMHKGTGIWEYRTHFIFHFLKLREEFFFALPQVAPTYLCPP